MAGPAYYFGQYYPKLTIGDALRPTEPEDILRANLEKLERRYPDGFSTEKSVGRDKNDL